MRRLIAVNLLMTLSMSISKADDDFEAKCWSWEDRSKIAKFLVERDECQKDLMLCNWTVENMKQPVPDKTSIYWTTAITFVIAGLVGYELGRTR